MKTIAEVFSEKIDRPIEEVIKVDALDDQIVLEEIREYYPTPSIQEQMASVLEGYAAAWRKPTDKVGVWVSGFFGAGKSSFAKLLGILLESRKVAGQDAIDLFSKRVTSDKVKLFLKQIREKQPTHVVIFDILKDNIAGAAQHTVTLVMYRALLRSLNYPTDIDLAELEINLEEDGRLDAFKAKYQEVHKGRTWDEGKRRTMTAFNEASAALHALDRGTYSAPDSWARTRARTDISPRKLADRAVQLAKVRAQDRNVVFVVDEIGQYTARSLSHIGDLQGVIESFGQVGRGKTWLIATSQEKLEAILDIYDKDRTQLARLQDRFDHKVSLKPGDIRDVASHRVLAKKADAEKELRELFRRQMGALKHSTTISASIDLPGLEEDPFVHLYPMLPYQIDLLINVVSGLRQQASGAQATMGGANRTIIKLAQQLLIHPSVGIASQPIGRLVTFDAVYELLSTTIATETQQEIDDIERHVRHPYAGKVAKALVLLQFAGAVHATEENVAAVLHPSVESPGVLNDVREAVEKLIEARKVRRTEHGLKIQSAAERTWDQERDGYRPTRGEHLRITKDALRDLWGQGASQPSHKLGGWKPFTGGLRLGNEILVDGNVLFDALLIEADGDETQLIEQSRAATQRDLNAVGWTLRISDEALRAITERARSERMEVRGARTRDEEPLLREEGRRRQRATDLLREELSKALCRGHMFFQGNERSPKQEASVPRAEARRVLTEALEKIFHRFADGDVQVSHSDAEAILRTEGLAGLPNCYSELGVLRSEGGQARLVTDTGAAKEVFDWIQSRCAEGRAPSGKELEQHFARPPYGWSIELMQLLVATLLRVGQVTVTSQSQAIKSALTPEARSAIANNTKFRAATVQVRESALDRSKLIQAAKALDERFGHSCPSITADAIAGVLRQKLGGEASKLESARDAVRELGLPGHDPLAQALSVLRSIQVPDDEAAVLTFLESVDTLAKAIPRARAIEEKVTEAARTELGRAKGAADSVGPVLERELGQDAKPREVLAALRGHLERETFYEHLPQISSAALEVISAFTEVYSKAHSDHRKAYEAALEELRQERGWASLPKEDQDRVALALSERANLLMEADAWRRATNALLLMREQTRAAPALLAEARAMLRQITAPKAVEIPIRTLLNSPISSPEELEVAIGAIREAVERALAEGRPVIFT
jgi:hypothetical protein